MHCICTHLYHYWMSRSKDHILTWIVFSCLEKVSWLLNLIPETSLPFQIGKIYVLLLKFFKYFRIINSIFGDWFNLSTFTLITILLICNSHHFSPLPQQTSCKLFLCILERWTIMWSVLTVSSSIPLKGKMQWEKKEKEIKLHKGVKLQLTRNFLYFSKY